MAKIVYANTIKYDFDLQQRPQHIMNMLAERGHEICWIDPQQPKKPTQYKKRINKNLTVYYDWAKFCQLNKNNVDIYFASWSVRWVDIDKLNPKYVIYDSLDLFPQNEKDEKKMADSADIILTTALALYNYHKKHTDKPIYMCENGCFAKHRNKNYSMPREFEYLKHNNLPIILFSGAMAINKTGWVDFEIIKEITKKYHIVCVGKAWGFDRRLVDKNKKVFDKLLNFGVKEYEDLQRYYHHCDINILPFRRCQIADYSFPLKTIEGCNHGKMCVSTDIPVSVQLNKEEPNSILISKNSKEFVKNIDIALSRKNNQENINACHNIANKHTWKQKVDIIENIIKGEFGLD